jgi:hypothetical protein
MLKHWYFFNHFFTQCFKRALSIKLRQLLHVLLKSLWKRFKLIFSFKTYSTPHFWASLHLSDFELRSSRTTTELRCILLSFSVPFWATLFPLSYAAPSWAAKQTTEQLYASFWATLHREQRCALLSYAAAAPYWPTLHPTELCHTHMSYAAPHWATLLPTE